MSEEEARKALVKANTAALTNDWAEVQARTALALAEAAVEVASELSSIRLTLEEIRNAMPAS